MATDFGRRFDELNQQAELLDNSKRMERPSYGVEGYRINYNDFLNWKVKVRHLLSSVCGPTSEHFKQFEVIENTSSYAPSHEIFLRLDPYFWPLKKTTRAAI